VRRAFPADVEDHALDDRLAAVREAASIAQDLDPELQFTVFDTLVDLSMAAGDYAGALATAKTAMPLLDKIGTAAPAGPYFEAALAMLDLAGDTPLALELARKSSAIDKNRSPHEQMHSTYALMRVGYRIGDWDLVQASLDEHLGNFALETGVHCINVQMGPSQGAVMLADRGQTERALELSRMPFAFEGIVGPIEGAQASALIAAGEVAEGLALAEKVLATAPRWRALEAAAAALQAVTFNGDALALDRQLTRLADVRAVGPHMAAIYDRAAGRAKALRGDPEAAALLRSVVESLDAQSAIFEAARTRELMADVMPHEARSLLEAALAVYRQLGAVPHVARVEARLATL